MRGQEVEQGGASLEASEGIGSIWGQGFTRQGSRLLGGLLSSWGLAFFLPQLRDQTGVPGCSRKPRSLESGPESWWPPIVPGHATSCLLGPGTVSPSLWLPTWAPVPQNLGLYLSSARF